MIPEGIRTLIFDWDGTLHETMLLYGDALRGAVDWLREMGVPGVMESVTDEQASVFLGMNAPSMWKCFMPSLPPEMADKASLKVAAGMIEGIQEGKARLYPGALKVLQELKQRGYSLVFLSNCRVGYCRAHREKWGLDRFFDAYYCCETYGFAPKEEIFRLITEDLGIEAKSCMMIGDRASDMKVAQVHGLQAAFCLYGYGEPAEKGCAGMLLHSIEDLIDQDSSAG